MFPKDCTIAGYDDELAKAIADEGRRQEDHVELIASENYASPRVMEAQGSKLTNKYAEGYPGKRYYGGCEYVDVAERLAIERCKQLFGATYANVQPHSGSQANQAVYFALLQPGDTILGMSLAHGGHLTHGAKPNISGKLFNAVQYGVDEQGLIDYDEVERLAVEHQPKMIVGGFSAYSQVVDWARMRAIADKVGAIFFVDMAHVAGLIAAGVYPSPLPHAHVCTSTTHKTLRGPRGGIIVAANTSEEMAKKLQSIVFPGIQGGPLMHVIAAKAVAFGEALQPSFRDYAAAVVANARALADTLVRGGLAIVSGGTDSHLMLVDLRPKRQTGRDAEIALERAGITCNKNGIPFDPEKPTVTSGIRLGTPAATTRGFGEGEFREVGGLIVEILDAMARGDAETQGAQQRVHAKVRDLCARFPIYAARRS